MTAGRPTAHSMSWPEAVAASRATPYCSAPAVETVVPRHETVPPWADGDEVAVRGGRVERDADADVRRGGGLDDLAGRELDELAGGDGGSGRERGLAVGVDSLHVWFPWGWGLWVT